jgi:hypothetical protein
MSLLLLLQSAASGGDATATGATLTVTRALLAGAASAASTAAGVTYTVAASLIAGAASAASAAAGVTLAVVVSLAAGAGSGGAPTGTASGVTLTLAVALLAGTAAALVVLPQFTRTVGGRSGRIGTSPGADPYDRIGDPVSSTTRRIGDPT